METVVCAAVKMRGEIFKGKRHGDCFQSARNRFGPDTKILRDEQGFITSTGRFVSREEGYELQIAANIPSASPHGYVKGTLFSEDLY